MEQKQIRIREATASDLPFVINSWLKSYKTSAINRHIADKLYFRKHHKIIEDLMGRSVSLVACHPDDEKKLFGYVVFEASAAGIVFHWAYVKESCRMTGVAAQLEKVARGSFSVSNVTFTMFNRLADKLVHGRGYHYVPFYLHMEEK